MPDLCVCVVYVIARANSFFEVVKCAELVEFPHLLLVRVFSNDCIFFCVLKRPLSLA